MNQTGELAISAARTSADTMAAGDDLRHLLNRGELVTRPWATSNVTRVECAGKTFYVKQYLEQADIDVSADVIRARMRREIDLLERMASLPPTHTRLERLKLVHADPDSGLLITEEASGCPLSGFIMGRFRRAVDRECQRALYLAGKWLQWYQSLPIRPGDEIRFVDDSPADLVDYCDIRMQKIRELGYGWPDDAIRRRISEQLRRLIRRASAEDRRFVWCHGDYGTQNMLWDGHTLTPLDFGTAHLDHPLLDVTYLIHRLEMQQIYRPWLRWPVEEWKRAILRGYGRPDAEQSPMYQALMIRHLHCRLKTYVRRPPLNAKQRVHNAWTRACVRAKLMAMVRREERSGD